MKGQPACQTRTYWTCIEAGVVTLGQPLCTVLSRMMYIGDEVMPEVTVPTSMPS